MGDASQPADASGQPALRAGSKAGSGRFTLVKELGRGGMGVVWLAQDTNLGEQVALKFLPPEVAADPVALNDLRRETVRSHRLTHPNIIRIHDFHQQTDGVAFISMEYVDGPTLSALRLQQPGQVFAWDQLVPLAQQLCAALEYAHGEGVIHRDLKPANVMLDSRGRLKLADFGIAAVVSDSVSRVSARSLSGGTLAYMSPQQITGSQPTVADDTYALGASMYELLTGRPPFYSGDITHQVLKVAPTPIGERLLGLGLDNPVPEQAAALIMACLTKEPGQRPAGARAVAEWLSLGSSTSSEPAAEEPPPDRNRTALWWALGIGGVAFTLVAVGLVQLGVRPKSSPLALSVQGVTLATATKEQPWVNSLGMKFVPVPGTDVKFSIWETRVQDFEAFVNVTGYDATQGTFSLGADHRYKPRGDTWNSPGFPQGPTHPVCGVNWDDAKAFCTWLTGRERKAGRLAMRQSYRLPTDAEWSRAVGLDNERGNTPKEKDRKTKGVYPWGNQWPPPPGTGNYGGAEARDETYPTGWATIDGYRDDYARTAPVGSFNPNRFGLFDLSGNVWEWCEDSYDGQAGSRFLRGGSWAYDVADGLLSSYRYYYKAWKVRGIGGGFRVVLAIENDSSLPTSAITAPPMASSVQALAMVTATKEKPWVNSLGMVFVPVPGTTVLCCIWETRVEDFNAYVEAIGYDATKGMFSLTKTGWKKLGHTWQNPGFPQAPSHPVVGVSMADARMFCSWLTKKEKAEKRLANDQEYRLPTSEEWIASLGMAERDLNELYPWGRQWPPPEAAGNYLGEEAENVDRPPDYIILKGYRDSYLYTAPVGSFKPNALGIYDLSGNAWELCGERAEENLNSAKARGASYGHGARESFRFLCTNYMEVDARMRTANIGFRLVLTTALLNRRVGSADSSVATTRITNSLGMVFVPVPGTQARFSIWETRVRDFEDFVNATGRDMGNEMLVFKNQHRDRQRGYHWKSPGFSQGPNHPAVGISWDDAQAFCAWLTNKERREGRLAHGQAYRLPTDPEWSHAAGLGDEGGRTPQERDRPTNVYRWGNQWPPPPGSGNFAGEEARDSDWPADLQTIAGYRDGYPHTAPVGSYVANPLGIFDLEGNVLEWTGDLYTGSGSKRAIRWGGWFSGTTQWCSSSYRSFEEPTFRASGIGFRCVLTTESLK